MCKVTDFPDKIESEEKADVGSQEEQPAAPYKRLIEDVTVEWNAQKLRAEVEAAEKL